MYKEYEWQSSDSAGAIGKQKQRWTGAVNCQKLQWKSPVCNKSKWKNNIDACFMGH